ncbi:MAG: DUF932 domain-containing protein [Pirellulales bacterium]|nr:DUF932 domain-containing protein [Pirellulales bacterium]
MTHLTQASKQLFRRSEDERYPSLTELWQYCQQQKEGSQDHWEQPSRIVAKPDGIERLLLGVGTDGAFEMTDWSFSQLCRLAGVSKDTVNRLSPETASRVFGETLPCGTKPLQVFEQNGRIRSIHTASYTRLFNADLLTMLREFATDFQPPQAGSNGATGLYAGEQDLFVFMIDPTGWAEIDGQAFAPGFFIWNSEVGRRSIGISTFWFQAVCQNHIVWDAVEVVDFTRKHTANMHECFAEVRRLIEGLVAKRDERRDGFVRVIRQAMTKTLGDDAEEVLKQLAKSGIPRDLGKRALDVAKEQGRFTVFAVVDALTRLTQEAKFAGDRTDADEKAAGLLSLIA